MRVWLKNELYALGNETWKGEILFQCLLLAIFFISMLKNYMTQAMRKFGENKTIRIEFFKLNECFICSIEEVVRGIKRIILKK